MDSLDPMKLYITRDGQLATIRKTKGLVTNNVVVGQRANKPGIECWNAKGQWRWDDKPHPNDIVGLHPLQTQKGLTEDVPRIPVRVKKVTALDHKGRPVYGNE